MKIMVALVFAASLMACGGKAKKTTTPDNSTGTATEPETTTPEGTGGSTYGGDTAPATPDAAGTDPCAGM